MSISAFCFLALAVIAVLLFAGIGVAAFFGLAEDPRGPAPHRDDE